MPLDFTFACPLPNGLHARPASRLAEEAGRFASDCTLANARTAAAVNARSVLALVGADVKLGDACTLHISGADEQQACAALRQFVEQELSGCDEPLAELTPAGAAALPRALRDRVTRWYPGLPVSRGVGHGIVVVVAGPALPPGLLAEPAGYREAEQETLDAAVAAVRARLAAALSKPANTAGAAILKAHLAIIDDVSLTENLAERIAQGRSAGQAVVETGEFFATRLKAAQSLYIRERALDVQDICRQLLEQIYGPRLQPAFVVLTSPAILVAETIAPRQLLALNPELLKGLVLGSAGTTSHAVILARALGVPALAGVKDAQLLLSPGEEIVVDADRGFVVADWTAPVQRFYMREWETMRRRKAALSRFAQSVGATADGQRLEIAANVASAAELAPAFENGAEGIGVFRTEMLFAGRDSAPPEEEQFEVYLQAARAGGARRVILRTLDIGGDKPLPYLDLPQEPNPFLGYRGVRIYEEYRDLLDTQLRAMIRASAFGAVNVMAPMISSLTEVRQFRAQVARVQGELNARGVAYDPAMPVGIMVEVPSVAFILDQLCGEVDFFSIGTNDLAQYFLAVDRDNARIASLSSVRHPSFLRLLRQVVGGAHAGAKWVGMCGEMGGDIRNLPLLVGLGLDEISAAASAIPALKADLSELASEDCRRLLEAALACRFVEEVDDLLEKARHNRPPRPLYHADLVLTGGDSTGKDEAIREIVAAFYVAGRTAAPRQVEDAVWAREAVYSTGLGYGFAIPHCKTDAMDANSIGVLKLANPVEWGSLDGEPVRMVILLAMRESDPNNTHMRVFAALARNLMHENFRDGLMNAADPASILAQLMGE